MSIIKHVTLQKIVAHDFRYDPRKTDLVVERPLQKAPPIWTMSQTLVRFTEISPSSQKEKHVTGELNHSETFSLV